jgi:hypothetical protein
MSHYAAYQTGKGNLLTWIYRMDRMGNAHGAGFILFILYIHVKKFWL